jgi:hypothetical protein
MISETGDVILLLFNAQAQYVISSFQDNAKLVQS